MRRQYEAGTHLQYSSRIISTQVVECTSLRILAAIPRPATPSREDTVVLTLVEWILVQDHTVRPYTADVIERVNSVLANLRAGDAV